MEGVIKDTGGKMRKLLLIFFFNLVSGMSESGYGDELCAHTFAGDFHLEAGDTLREDVSVSGGNAVIDGYIDGDLAVMGGSVEINGILDGDIAVFGGEIENRGKITGDAGVAGGSIVNWGVIEGDIAVAGGSVELDSGSVVKGDIAIVGGSVERSDYAEVEGEIVALDIGKLNKVMPNLGPLLRWRERAKPLSGILFGLISLAFFGVVYLLNLLAFLVFPGAIARIKEKIEKDVWVSIAIGIGIEILIVPLIILFVISIIGIPIIPAFILAVFIAIIFGFCGLSIVLGERIVAGLNWQSKNRIAIFTIGWLALVLVAIIGGLLKGLGFLGTLILIIGYSILFVGITIGLGAVLFALIKRDKVQS